MNSYTRTRCCGMESGLTLMRAFHLTAVLFAAAAIAGIAKPVHPASAAEGTAPRGPALEEMALGRDDAPVTIIEYASLSCPHCATFHEETLPALREKYIDTGKVRLVFREFPLERTAFWASIIARCAGEKRYFAFIDVFFKKQQAWYSAEDPFEALTRIARLGGLSAKDAEACREDKALGDYILQIRLDGERDHGIDSTPSFVIDGKTYRGVLTLEQIERIIAPLLP